MHHHKKSEAIRLRLEGNSYNEIRKILNLPSKGTLSKWFIDLKLTPEALIKLQKNNNLAEKRGLTAFNQKRKQKIQSENEKIFLDAQNCVNKISERELLLIGISLYWGEGYKSPSHPKFSFTNSDPQMIALMMVFVRKILQVPDLKIRTHIHTHLNVETAQAIIFWSNLTKLPPENFRIVKQISRASNSKRPINLLPYGTLDIRINSRQLYYKMMGLIKGLHLT